MDPDDETPAFAITLGAMYGSSPEASDEEEETEIVVSKAVKDEGGSTKTQASSQESIETASIDTKPEEKNVQNTEESKTEQIEERDFPEEKDKHPLHNKEEEEELSSICKNQELRPEVSEKLTTEEVEPEKHPEVELVESRSHSTDSISNKSFCSESLTANQDDLSGKDENLKSEENKMPLDDQSKTNDSLISHQPEKTDGSPCPENNDDSPHPSVTDIENDLSIEAPVCKSISSDNVEITSKSSNSIESVHKSSNIVESVDAEEHTTKNFVPNENISEERSAVIQSISLEKSDVSSEEVESDEHLAKNIHPDAPSNPTESNECQKSFETETDSNVVHDDFNVPSQFQLESKTTDINEESANNEPDSQLSILKPHQEEMQPSYNEEGQTRKPESPLEFQEKETDDDSISTLSIPKTMDDDRLQSTQLYEISSQSHETGPVVAGVDDISDLKDFEELSQTTSEPVSDEISSQFEPPPTSGSCDSENTSTSLQETEEKFMEVKPLMANTDGTKPPYEAKQLIDEEKTLNVDEKKSSVEEKPSVEEGKSSRHVTVDKDTRSDEKGKVTHESKKNFDKVRSEPVGGRRLRQIRHPSVKAAEAAADAAFVAAVTPTRKNLKEAKIACAIANVSEKADMNLLAKKSATQSFAPRMRKIRSSSNEPTLLAPADSSGVYVDEPSISDKDVTVESAASADKGQVKGSSVPEESSDVLDESVGNPQSKMSVFGEPGKLIGIKLKISKESVQILDPPQKKLEVQIPSETAASEVTSATPSPGGSKKSRKSKEEQSSSNASLSPITLKISKSKEGLEVVPGDADAHILDSEVAKVEKITLKLSKGDSASIVKQGSSWDESSDSRGEKPSMKAVIDDQKVDDSEETKLEKITLKLSRDDGACIIKKKDSDVSSSAEIDSGKLERITLKVSPDNNVSIVRGKDSGSQENSLTNSDSGKVEKITLKVSKNDNVCIVKPSSPVPSVSSVEKLTLKVSKDGTAALSGRSRDDSPSSRESDCSKLEKITLKLSKEEGVSIVKPSSPTPERLTKKAPKDEPLSPLSPLTISRSDETEPQKERITLKLSKAGGYPSPVGTLEECSSWSIKFMESDSAPSPTENVTPKTKPKRALSEASETVPAKKLKLTEVEKSNSSEDVAIIETVDGKKYDNDSSDAPVELDVSHSSKRFADSVDTEEPKKIKVEEPETSEPPSVWPSAGKAVEVVDVDSEESQCDPPATSEISMGDQKVTIVDLEDEIPSSVVLKRKPRGRPRKAVLTPGAIPPGTIPSTPDTSTSRKTVAKQRKEKALLEPPESDRPKRVCKGREKPPPKPPKPAKPRGRNAAKQGTTVEADPVPNSMTVEAPQLFEEETRMSADCGSRSQTPASATISSVASSINGLQMTPKVMIPRLSTSSLSMHSTPSATPAQSPGPPPLNEESQGSMSIVSSTTTESTPNKGNRKGRMEINVDPDAKVEYTVDMIAEYVWPVADGRAGETYMVQEQISEFLKVKSFKRKYPNMLRRTVDHDERQYLLERRLVSESLCDLGLTAVPSHEVLDVMCTDFPEKYEEYRRFTREKAARELSNKQKAMVPGSFSGKEDPKSKAMRNMATFNSVLNRSRREHRRCCFDLQTFSVHYPEDRRSRMTIQNIPQIGAYPIALVPGQYTDFFKEYTATELRYFPLNTVLYGPLLPHETMKTHVSGGSDGSQTDTSDSSSSDGSSSESGSSGSDSDSDSGSSSESDDESSSQTGAATAESQESEIDRPDAICRICNGDRLKNKAGRAEPLVHCSNCAKSGHPSCLDLTVDMVPHIKKYAWQCTDCKLCAQCNDTADEDKMLFCDMCDRGYHIYCVGLRKVPEGRWHCRECAMCASCGARSPGGTEEQQAAISQAAQETPTKIEIPQWQHEFKKGDKGTRIYVRTLCVPCSKLWRKGRYCRLCWKCYSNQPEEEGLINCSVCDRWMHADCCRKAGRVIDMDKLGSFLCELCQQKGVRIPGIKSPVKLFRS